MNLLPRCCVLALVSVLLAGLLLDAAAQQRQLPVDTTITSRHEVTVNGARIPYEATVGTQPVYGEDGAPIASLFYTFYQRSDVDDVSRRPLFISFNGGPGSGSLWMHLGYTSPKQLIIDDEGYPVQPYGVRDNPPSISGASPNPYFRSGGAILMSQGL